MCSWFFSSLIRKVGLIRRKFGFKMKESWFKKKENRLEGTHFSFPCAPVTSAVSGLNIPLSILCSKTFKMCYFLILNDGIAHPTTPGNAIFVCMNIRINFLAPCKNNPVEGTSLF